MPFCVTVPAAVVADVEAEAVLALAVVESNATRAPLLFSFFADATFEGEFLAMGAGAFRMAAGFYTRGFLPSRLEPRAPVTCYAASYPIRLNVKYN